MTSILFILFISPVMGWLSSYTNPSAWYKPSTKTTSTTATTLHSIIQMRTPITSGTRNNSDSDANPSSNCNSIKPNLTSLRTLYPPATFSRNGTIQVDDIHNLYYEIYNEDEDDDDVYKPTDTTAPSATPTSTPSHTKKKTALFLHGGPGAGSYPNHARFFHPDYYRVVLVDQRGCGRSTPRGELRNNTLEHLVHDLDVLRRHVFMDAKGTSSNRSAEDESSSWDLVLGGSWGTTLALAYAQTYPQSVKSMVLRGVFLMRTPEINWMFGSTSSSSRDGSNWKTVSSLAPKDEWKEFEDAACMKPEELGNEMESQRNVLHRYYDCLLGDDPFIRACAAQGWHRWEMKVNSFLSHNISAAEPSMVGKQPWIVRTNDHVLDWNKDRNRWSLQSTNRSSHDYDASSDIESYNQDDFVAAAQSFRRWSNTAHDRVDGSYEQQQQPRPVQPVSNFKEQPQNMTTKFDIQNFIPAQAMLTCYYSVNNEYIMSNFSLLNNIHLIRHIPCITIAGGNDLICPTDTALDLHMAWPEMTLRLVCSGKHSMYDPSIASEIVKATDLLAGVPVIDVDE